MDAPLPGKERDARWREVARRVGQYARAGARRVRRGDGKTWACLGCALAAIWIVRLEFRLASVSGDLGLVGDRPSGLSKEVDRATEDARVALELARAAHHATRSLEAGPVEVTAEPSPDERALDRAAIAEALQLRLPGASA